MILSPFSWATTSATTRAPATIGRPISRASPSLTSSTRSSSTVAPTSAGSFSTWSVSLGWTLYCLPPVSTTAYIVHFPRARPARRRERTSPPVGPARPARRPSAAGNEKPLRGAALRHHYTAEPGVLLTERGSREPPSD